MSVFKIEKSVPVPAPRTEKKYPFAEMAVGDSFVISPDVVDVATVRAAAHNHGKFHNKKFVTRKLGKLGVRIWRTE